MTELILFEDNLKVSYHQTCKLFIDSEKKCLKISYAEKGTVWGSLKYPKILGRCAIAGGWDAIGKTHRAISRQVPTDLLDGSCD